MQAIFDVPIIALLSNSLSISEEKTILLEKIIWSNNIGVINEAFLQPSNQYRYCFSDFGYLYLLEFVEITFVFL
jgi:hypothetical protein